MKGEARSEVQNQEGRGLRVQCTGQQLKMKAMLLWEHSGRVWESIWSQERLGQVMQQASQAQS